MPRRIIVTLQDARVALHESLGRAPTKKELESFVEWLERDIGQWLSDNVKSWNTRDI